MSASQKARHSAPATSKTARGPLGIVTGSGIIETGSTGEITSESWSSTRPPFLSVTAAEARSPHGGPKLPL